MFSNELWNKSGVSTYSIDQSIRFNSADTAYMHRTPSSTGNRKTFTSSFWVKLGKLGVNTQLPMPGVTHGIGSSGLSLTTANVLNAYIYYGGSWSGLLIGTRVFRDPSAWYHFVIVVDTTQAVSTERIQIYVNGQRETNFSSEAYPTQNTDTDWNLSGEKMWIGIDPSGSGYNGEYYASEMVYIDGQALDPSSFAEENENGIWIPKDVSSLSFGTNGFYLKGENASDLGNDSSSNNNDFTTSGLAAHDQVLDSPTNNHTTWNVLRPTGSTTMSDGNLTVTTSGATYKSILGTIGIPPNSGIFYYEGVVLSHTIQLMLGWGSSEMGVNQNNNPATPKYFAYADYLGKYYSSSGDGSVGDAFENNDVIGLWIDTDNTSNNLKFYRNGTLQSTHSFDFSDVDFIMPLTQHLNGCSVTGRFASNQWTQTPSGITDANAINTKNLGS